MQTEVTWAHHKITWTSQDHLAGNGTGSDTKRQTEKAMGRQHQGLDWNIILWKAENHEAGRKLVVKPTVVPHQSARLLEQVKMNVRRICFQHSPSELMPTATSSTIPLGYEMNSNI